MLKSNDVPETALLEATVVSGLILLVLIGVLIGFAITRIRGRLGLRVTGSTWLGIIAFVVIMGLVLFVTAKK